MRLVLVIILQLQFLLSQDKLPDSFEFALRTRGLAKSDITIPSEFLPSGEKLPISDVKFLLPLVRNIMSYPLYNISWLDSIANLKDSIPEIIVKKLFQIISSEFKFNYTSQRIETDYKGIESLIKESKSGKSLLVSVFSWEQFIFLKNNISSLLESPEDNKNITDIFVYNNVRDSSILLSRTLMENLSRTNISLVIDYSYKIFNKAYYLYRFYSNDMKNQKKLIKELNPSEDKENFHLEIKDYGMKIAIGGYGRNFYRGSYNFIIDFGGNDVYIPETSAYSGISCIIDLGGNDFYSSTENFSLAGGFYSSSFIFDKSGNDIYQAKGFGNLGAAIAGIAILLDEEGNDIYRSDMFSQGAGCFGLGLLIDKEGNDIYLANSYSQGFGLTMGTGCIMDNHGNDSYLAEMTSLDIGRYEDHYISMSQGYGFGLRPYYAGGIGLIIESEGNDIYNSDIFGQGGGYWYGLGVIIDKSGHDKYNGYQYSQGAGIHLATGILKDHEGWDFYSSNGVSQGCGHDFGLGLLWDKSGNDNYSSYSLSQGAGNANGIGILIDENGTDGYLNKFPSNSRGYGNPRREFGSIGIFLDISGKDYYSEAGSDSTLQLSSCIGIFLDFHGNEDLSVSHSADFRLPVDSNRSYTTNDYFIMAKTIEPRFSLWQEYGFRKLIEDSLNSAEFIISRFATEDHRDVQVFRVLAQKIPFSVNKAIYNALTLHFRGIKTCSVSELNMLCYISGETRNDLTREYLLELSSEENYRIRSTTINALGKINYNLSDNDFINRVSFKLNLLATELTDKKIYKKDVAFALGNYITDQSFRTLIQLLENNYFGTRFTAAESLKKFFKNGFTYDFRDHSISWSEVQILAFISSLDEVDDKELIKIYELFDRMMLMENDVVIYNFINLIKSRITKSDNPWFKEKIKELESKLNLKIK